MKKMLSAQCWVVILCCISFSSKAQSIYQVDWEDLNNVVETGTELAKVAGLGTIDAGAGSVNQLQPLTDGWFEFRLIRPITQNDIYIGFSVVNLDDSPTTIRYGLRLKTNGEVDFYEGGWGRGTISSQNIGDDFKIAREGVNIVFYRNDEQVASYARENDVALIVDVSLEGANSAIADAVASFDAGPGQTPITPLPVTPPATPTPVTGSFYEIDWTDVEGVNVDNLDLNSSESTGWGNSGTASSNRLAVGEDGWFEFTITKPITHNNFCIGFSNGNVDESYLTIRHGLLFKGNGQIAYTDGGWARTTFANYNVGDIFRLGREGDDMVCYKNGTEVYRAIKGNDTELIIDVAFNYQWAGVSNVIASFGTTILPQQVVPQTGGNGPWDFIAGSTTDTYTSGAVAIQGAVLPAGYSLAVGGSLIAESVKVALVTNWPDYVFKPGYKLLSLEETKKYIEQHGHLPGVPSAQKAQSEGVELLEMNQKLLEKVEELTLHLIQQNEMLKKQQLEIEKLKKKKIKD